MKAETLKQDLLKNKSHDPVKNVQALFDLAYSTGDYKTSAGGILPPEIFFGRVGAFCIFRSRPLQFGKKCGIL